MFSLLCFFSHSFLSFNKNNDKARINFPTHFMSNVELVKQKVQKYNFYNNFETFNSFSGCVWQQWSLNIALFLFSIASKSWAPCEHRPLATLYMITPFIIIYICAPLNTTLSNSLCIIRGVARIFYMGGPIFDDDDYHRCMDNLYI